MLRTALVRGAFEYSGQKCSAASRAYVARSVWNRIKDDLIEQTEALPVGDVRDFANFTSAVIDQRPSPSTRDAIDRATTPATTDDHRRRHRSTITTAGSSGRP